METVLLNTSVSISEKQAAVKEYSKVICVHLHLHAALTWGP